MRCKLQPKLRCAGCTQTRVHMLTHDACSLSSIRSRKPQQWTLRLCHVLTYLSLFIGWVLQITLTFPQVYRQDHFLRKHSRRRPCFAVLVCFPSFTGELTSFNQSDARFVEHDKQFPEHVQRSVLDLEHSFVAVRRTARTRFAK